MPWSQVSAWPLPPDFQVGSWHWICTFYALSWSIVLVFFIPWFKSNWRNLIWVLVEHFGFDKEKSCSVTVEKAKSRAINNPKIKTIEIAKSCPRSWPVHWYTIFRHLSRLTERLWAIKDRHEMWSLGSAGGYNSVTATLGEKALAQPSSGPKTTT